MRGGAIYLEGAKLEVSGRVNFDSNEGERGGAIYVEYCSGYALFEIPQGPSTINFSSAVVNFINNKAGHGFYGFGGAIYADNKGGVINFNGSKINFEGNKGGKGGGIYGEDNSNIVVEDSELNFIDNEVNGYRAHGGGICIERGTRWENINSTINFIGNKAGGLGGGIRALKASINIVGSEVNFERNEGMFGGGICVDKRDVVFDDDYNHRSHSNNMPTRVVVSNSKVRFSGNRAEAGGGMHVDERGEVVFENSVISFENNVASSSGGAISVINSKVKMKGEIRIINNEAGMCGGGVYVEGGEVGIDVGDKVGEFRGNMANGKSNGIHIEGKGVVRFDIGAKGVVNMDDAITSRGIGGIVDICGKGKFKLNSNEKTIIEKLNIKDNIEFDMGKGAQLEVGKSLMVEEGARLNIVNGGTNRVSVGEYVQEGKVDMEVFGGGEGEEWERSDQIVCEGRVRLGERSKLEIKEKGYCKGKSYMLIRYVSLEGVFGDVIVENHEVEYGYEGKWIVLLPKVVEEMIVAVDNLWISGITNAGLPNIGVVNKDELSSNEIEVGEKLSYLSGSVDEKDRDKKAALRILKGLDAKEKKEALSETSGYFISNVLVSQMLDNGDRSIYEHVQMNGEYKEGISNKVWAKAKGEKIGIDGSENSPGRLEVNKGEVIAGVDIVRKEEVMVGVGCEFNKDWIKQGGNEGEVKNNGVGIYGGISKGKIDVKGIVIGRISEYEIKREINLGVEEKAKGDTRGIKGELDMEVGYRVGNKRVKVRPYVGVNTKVVELKGYKEEGEYALRLEVEGKEYVRSRARAGVEVKGMEKDFGWNIGGGVKCVLIGEEIEIGSRIIGTEVEMKTRGAEVGGEVGGMYKITERLQVYAEVGMRKASKYRNIAGNMGVKYSF
ncbi:MAG: autotransporter outer membrane beta-barrel domain-containing protein [Endomicrobium sp.]|nr:autotransporter outer membrane beta-barrel domain-containing protein [Endomicrobium sp.]